MLRLRRIWRDYAETGALNELIALWGFVDDTTFLTKAGHVGVVYRVTGIDPEGLTPEARAQVVHGLEAALRLLDERQRLSQYLIKRTIDPLVFARCDHPVADEAIQDRARYLNARGDELFDLSLYFVLVHEDPTSARTSSTLQALWRDPREALRAWLSGHHVRTLLRRDLERAIATLHHQAEAVEIQLRELGLTRLDKAAAFQFFRRLVNYDRGVAPARRLQYDTHLDYFVADSALECHRDHLQLGHQRVKVLSMKEPPHHTFAHQLGDLQAIPGEFMACLEWQRLPMDRMRRELQARRRHFFNSRVSLVNYVSPETSADEMLVDESASTTVRQLGDALTAVEVDHHFFGACSLTLVLHGEDPAGLDHQAAEAAKRLAVHDAAMFEETYNLLNAWLATIPGNGAYNLRRLALLETNAADLSFLFTRTQGTWTCPHLGHEMLAVLETPHGTPYALTLHVDDVGHTLVLGATGSGKSFLLNFLLTHAQKYAPRTLVLDLSHSYEKLAARLGGSYLALGLERGAVTVNPFALDPTAEHLDFLQAFVRVLLEGDDTFRLSDAEDRELYAAIESLYSLEPPQRRLLTLSAVLPRSLAQRLHRWVGDGRYAALFDNIEDTLTLADLQVLDFQAMGSYPTLLEPLLLYVLHRTTTQLAAAGDVARLKLCVLDEAWRFIQHPTLRAYVEEGLKTWRKHNAAMVLATQTIDDFASAALLRTVVESCPTTLFLANPGLDPTQYAQLFHLNETELALLRQLRPRRELLLKRPATTKVLALTVDPTSYWIYTNTPPDNARMAAALRADGGLEAGLARLALPPTPDERTVS